MQQNKRRIVTLSSDNLLLAAAFSLQQHICSHPPQSKKPNTSMSKMLDYCYSAELRSANLNVWTYWKHPICSLGGKCYLSCPFSRRNSAVSSRSVIASRTFVRQCGASLAQRSGFLDWISTWRQEFHLGTVKCQVLMEQGGYLKTGEKSRCPEVTVWRQGQPQCTACLCACMCVYVRGFRFYTNVLHIHAFWALA